MKAIVVLVGFVNDDATLVCLELEVTYAVKFYAQKDLWEHSLDEVCSCISVVAVLRSKSFADVPYEMPKVEGRKPLLQADWNRSICIVICPLSDFIAQFG